MILPAVNEWIFRIFTLATENMPLCRKLGKRDWPEDYTGNRRIHEFPSDYWIAEERL
jgi:hypothetical protein